MKRIVCVSNNMGMMFNHRRQSKDKELIQKVLEVTEGSRLWLSEYTAGMFDLPIENVMVDNDCISKAKSEDFCFAEDLPMDEDRTDAIFLFCWNRDYPADSFFEMDLSYYVKKSEIEFEGNSHELISMIIYESRENGNG